MDIETLETVENLENLENIGILKDENLLSNEKTYYCRFVPNSRLLHKRKNIILKRIVLTDKSIKLMQKKVSPFPSCYLFFSSNSEEKKPFIIEYKQTKKIRF